ncbi:MAG: cytochrome b/b6 domain-containing protein [Peptococcaceae bacterium]|nr:cytochrome b/b6 domain-containing protein [Peptococcaceae bacterium]
MVEMYLSYKTAIFTTALVLPAALSVLHLIFFGVKDSRLKHAGKNLTLHRGIKRFSPGERVLHLAKMVFFTLAALTGLNLVFSAGGAESAGAHGLSGVLFALCSIIVLFVWFRDGIFREYDGVWLKSLGGYFSKEHPSLPAGRFNAGQKIFFWTTALLALLLLATGISLFAGMHGSVRWFHSVLAFHGLGAALAMSLIIGHIYLSLVANPGTWRAMATGWVSVAWARFHHPEWDKWDKK